MIPELLAPAGSFSALRAAVDGGADAVYFGLPQFNARRNAENFTMETVGDAIRYCRLFGVKTHIVLNIALYDKELSAAADLAGELLSLGADAFIVADLGLASLLRERYPHIVLHASTQCSGQNVLSAKRLADLGFSRMVAARELSCRDILTLTKESPIETEIFVHGALCVSHSGQCLMSSVIGGRSGNRGECAQPCRLPYRTAKTYPLSLKDLCLAEHIPEIIEAGVASLKIEGRMKNPDYVYGVVSVYRKLLDESRAATAEEMQKLSALFSRSGFTDGYFTGRIVEKMLGIRTEEDKRASVSKPRVYGTRRLPLSLEGCFMAGEPATLTGTVKRGGEAFSATVCGEVCNLAEKTPTGKERLAENLSKLGATVFSPDKVTVTENGVNVPISAVNALRRALCERLEEQLVGKPQSVETAEKGEPSKSSFARRGAEVNVGNSAFFVLAERVTPRAFAYFDRIFLPLTEYVAHPELGGREKVGVVLPPVMLDHERSAVTALLQKAVAMGCRMALVSGLWQSELADTFGLQKHGDLRLNCYNTRGASVYEKMGLCSLVLSPEIGIGASKGIHSDLPTGVVVYGRLPLMTLEKCIIRDNVKGKNKTNCNLCAEIPFFSLTDRTGTSFPVYREFSHRNVICNSVPIYMADRRPEGLFGHFIFTDETPEQVDEILSRFEKRLPPVGNFKRL